MEELSNTANKWLNLKAIGETTIDKKIILIAIVINTKGGSSNTCKIYDNNTLGDTTNVIATIDTTASIGRLPYGLPLFTGLHINIQTGTAPDITVIYREF